MIGLLWSIPNGYISQFFPAQIGKWVNFATLLMAFGLIFYLRLSVVMFLGILAVCLACSWGNHALAQSGLAPLWAISLGIFVVAWIEQFYGHKVEGKKPSFLKDVQFLMIGPA